MPFRYALPVLTAAALAGSSAFAFPTFVGHISFSDSYGSLGGGEFRSVPQADFTVATTSTGTPFQFGVAAGAPQFESFCLEKFEHIDTSGAIFRADLNIETVASAPQYAAGALGGFNDPLDSRTAYLYDHFIHHTLLTSYDYVNEANRITDANSLQTAIWFIEQEDATPLTGKALDLFNEASAAVSSGTWTGLGNVRVLNIYSDGDRNEFQDELVLVPTPGTALLVTAGLLSIGRRRRV